MFICRAPGRKVLNYLALASLLYLFLIIIFETYEYHVGLTEDTYFDVNSKIDPRQSDNGQTFRPDMTKHQKPTLSTVNHPQTDNERESKEDVGVETKGNVLNTDSERSLSHHYRVQLQNPGIFTSQNSKGDNPRKWQKVGPSNDLFVFSAYFDHVTLIVEVVALISRNAVYRNVNCQFDSMAYVTNASLLPVDKPEAHVKYYTVILQCPSPIHPERVGVTHQGFTTQLKVIRHTSRLHDFTVCLPCLFGPFSNTSRLIETVEMDIILGAGFFTVYRYSTSPEVDKVLDHYVQAGRMEVVKWNKPEVDLHHYGQWAHIQDCLLSNRYRTRYLVVKDIDELIAPRTQINWDRLMNHLQTNPNISSFVFQNAFFDMHLTDFSWRNLSSHHLFPLQNLHQGHHLACLTHLWRLPRFSPAGFRVKSIIRPEGVRVAGIHKPLMLTDWSIQMDVSTDMAFVHHYREGFPEFKETVRDSFMLKFAYELVKQWEKVMDILKIDYNGEMERNLSEINKHDYIIYSRRHDCWFC